MVDKNAFFRQATLRICGHLDVENTLHACAQYLESFIPVDKMYLQLYQPDIPALTYHFLERRSKAMKISTTPSLAPGAMIMIHELIHHWR